MHLWCRYFISIPIKIYTTVTHPLLQQNYAGVETTRLWIQLHDRKIFRGEKYSKQFPWEVFENILFLCLMSTCVSIVFFSILIHTTNFNGKGVIGLSFPGLNSDDFLLLFKNFSKRRTNYPKHKWQICEKRNFGPLLKMCSIMQSNQGTWKVRKQEESPLLLPLPPITHWHWSSVRWTHFAHLFRQDPS